MNCEWTLNLVQIHILSAMITNSEHCFVNDIDYDYFDYCDIMIPALNMFD